MNVTVTAGSTSRTVEVPDDLLFRAFADRHQDAAQAAVARAFVEAYRAEVGTIAADAPATSPVLPGDYEAACQPFAAPKTLACRCEAALVGGPCTC